MPKLTEAGILETFDAASASYDWPDFGNLNIDTLSSRLIAYRDDERWAVVFNSIIWSDRNLCTAVEPIGNCVSIPVRSDLVQASEALYEDLRKDFYEDPRRKALIEKFRPGGFFWGLFKLMGAKESEMVDPLKEFERTKQDRIMENARFAAKHIDTVNFDYADDGETVVRISVRGEPIVLAQLDVQPQAEVPNDRAFWTAVAVADKYRDRILAQEEELANFFPEGLPPRLLALDDWRHSEEEAPSETETFRLLARAIATGNADDFRPTEKPNTHWKNWFPK